MVKFIFQVDDLDGRCKYFSAIKYASDLKYFNVFNAAFIVLLIGPPTQAQDMFAGYEHLFTTPRQYTAYQPDGEIRIDGKLKENSWDAAPWSEYFIDIEGDKKVAPVFNTRFKLLWDAQNIYIAAELEEPNIWANVKQHDAVVFYDNDFEIFIDPDGDTHNYFEIEVNAINTIFDLFLVKPYRNGGPILINWDVQNLRSAISSKGKINRSKGTDQKWFVEMAIPLRSLSFGNGIQLPKDQAIWRINFSRVQWDTDIVKGKYVKKMDSITSRPLPEHNWVWSPQGVVDMHLPERWGYLHFSTQKAGTPKIDVSLPPAEKYKKYLWLLFYQQQQYRQQHQRYASELTQLNLPAIIELPGIRCKLSLEANSSQYKAVIQSFTENENWQINHEGKINKILIP